MLQPIAAPPSTIAKLPVGGKRKMVTVALVALSLRTRLTLSYQVHHILGLSLKLELLNLGLQVHGIVIQVTISTGVVAQLAEG